MSTEFSLARFEAAVHACDYDTAHAHTVLLMNELAEHRGVLGDEPFARVTPNDPRDLDSQQVTMRIAQALTALFSDPRYELTPDRFTELCGNRWWIRHLFGATPWRNTDHIVRALLDQMPACPDVEATNALTRKQLLLYTSESLYDIDLDALAKADPVFAASLGMMLLAAAVVVSPAANDKRERMIDWLPGALDAVTDLDDLPGSAVCATYMHCSYATSPDRHAVKRSINALVRRKLKELGLLEYERSCEPVRQHDVSSNDTLLRDHAGPNAVSRIDTGRATHPSRKPLMLVVLEWFTGGHSIYRTHSRTLLAARENFEVVAFGESQHVDEKGRAVFDRFIAFEHPEFVGDCMKQLLDFANEHRPEVMYMPSVGMFTHTIFASNLRFAPLQIAGLGHPATMHSEQMDYVSVEDDFVGDAACFSERLMRLPNNAQPYVPSALLETVKPSVPARRDIVEIAVTASAMKLNPRFLEACRAIIAGSTMPVRFHFMTSWSEGVELAYLRHALHQIVPPGQALVYGALAYPHYLDILNTLDMFVSPFPFGNTNGIVDAFTLGLPGVNLCGREVFEHIDSGLFARAGLPAWLTTSSVDDYVAAAIRLAGRHDEREALRRQLIDTHAVNRIFEGRPQAFGEQIAALVRQRTAA